MLLGTHGLGETVPGLVLPAGGVLVIIPALGALGFVVVFGVVDGGGWLGMTGAVDVPGTVAFGTAGVDPDGELVSVPGVVPVPAPAGTHGNVVGDVVVVPGVVIVEPGVGARVPDGAGTCVPLGVGAWVPVGVGACVPDGVGA